MLQRRIGVTRKALATVRFPRSFVGFPLAASLGETASLLEFVTCQVCAALRARSRHKCDLTLLKQYAILGDHIA